jgi:hypothetical protein
MDVTGLVPAYIERLVVSLGRVLNRLPILAVVKSSVYMPSASEPIREVLVPLGVGDRDEPVEISSFQWTPHMERHIPQTYQVMRQVASVTLPLGFQVVPAVYGMKNLAASAEADNQAYWYVSNVLGSTSEEVHPVDSLYMQYLAGTKLSSNTVTLAERNAIIGYIHHILAYLTKRLGFSHGKLTFDSILLWTKSTGEEERESYILPLIDEDGRLIQYIALPYRPMLVGLEASKTATASQYSETTSPFSGELEDIMTLYTTYNPVVQDRGAERVVELPGVELIGRYARGAWEELEERMPAQVEWRLPPYGWALENLTHANMARHYREVGAFNGFERNGVTTKNKIAFGSAAVPSPQDRFNYAVKVPDNEIANIARATREMYDDPVFDTTDIVYRRFFATIRSYLDETERYYRYDAMKEAQVRISPSASPSSAVSSVRSFTTTPSVSVESQVASSSNARN